MVARKIRVRFFNHYKAQVASSRFSSKAKLTTALANPCGVCWCGVALPRLSTSTRAAQQGPTSTEVGYFGDGLYGDDGRAGTNDLMGGITTTPAAMKVCMIRAFYRKLPAMAHVQRLGMLRAKSY